MNKHVGIVACSSEGAALCYRVLCTEAAALMGEYQHPEVTLHSQSLSEYVAHIRDGNWPGVGQLIRRSAEIVAAAGARFMICPDNTIHQAYELVAQDLPIPWLHIAESVGREASLKGHRRLGMLGTKSLVNSRVYPDALTRLGIECSLPRDDQLEHVDRIIYEELVKARFPDESRRYLYSVVEDLRDAGCDAVVLGCTELPLIMDEQDCPLPTMDSTRLLAKAAIYQAVGGHQAD